MTGVNEMDDKNKKIMIIDDNMDFSEAIKTILETDAYDVDIANSTDVALKMLDSKVPDLIILDILMQKGAEGIILARKFKSDPKLSKVPILMLTSIRKQTGFTFIEDDPRNPKYLPVEEFVEKPIPPKELLAKVKKMLSR